MEKMDFDFLASELRGLSLPRERFLIGHDGDIPRLANAQLLVFNSRTDPRTWQ